jgi:nucleoid DNA-binding protein
MTANEMIRQMAADNHLTMKECHKWFDLIMDTIEDTLITQGSLTERGRFSVKVIKKPERTLWSNLYNKYMKSGGYYDVEFSASKKFLETLNRTFRKRRGKSDE